MRYLASILALALTISNVGFTRAQGPALAGNITPGSAEPGIEQWLMRMHVAARQCAYAGTFVVTAGNLMSSSRIWHVFDGLQQMERVDALTGPPRSTFRRNDQVATFFPDSRQVVLETRESLGLFPNLLNQADLSVAQFYRLKAIGRGRVAGVETDVVQLVPIDGLRFGYRVWTDRKTGLVIKLQTLNNANTVLEEAAFSELKLGAPVTVAQLNALMDNTQGYRVSKPELVKTTADHEGWLLKTSVPGFKSMSCLRRADVPLAAGSSNTLQCVYSDGLASVSLFIEAFDPLRRDNLPPHDQLAMGATHMLMRQMGAWWITAVGEVPLQTLAVFTQGLERKK